MMRIPNVRAILAAVILGGLIFGPVGIPSQQVAAATPRTFYVDCSSGNDNANGTSIGTAWKTVGRANKASLSAGDSLLFKRGCTWSGPLNAKWNGTASQRITIGAYGSGAIPVIKNASDGNVKVTGSYQTIENIKSNFDLSAYDSVNKSCSNQPIGASWRVGVNFVGGHHNTVRNFVVTGGSLGVNFTNSSHHNKLVDNQIIDNHGAWNTQSKWPQGGAAVFLHGDANEVAYNRFENNHTYCWDESVSIELYDATNSNVHHNMSMRDKVFVEAGSGNVISKNNTFAYNSHFTNRERARFLVTRGEGQPYGPVWNTTLYDNTIYYAGDNSQGVVCSSCGPNVLKMRNTIIVAKAKAVFSGGGSLDESNNIFWKVDGGSLPHDFIQGFTPHSTTKVVNPKLVNPSAGDFHVQSSSPAVNAGHNESSNVGYVTDIGGHAVPSENKVDIGVDEVGQSTASTPEEPVDEPDDEPEIAVTALPGKLEVENYKASGYHDTTAGNTGGACRNGDVDLVSTSDAGGGCNVGYVAAGEWLAYDVEVASAGTYAFTARVATIYSGRSFHIKVDGVDVTGPIQVPNTGGWQNWKGVSTGGVNLSAGRHQLRIVFDSGDFNLNYIYIRTAISTNDSGSDDSGSNDSVAFSDPYRIEAEDYRSGGPGAGYNDATSGNAGGQYRDDDVDIRSCQVDAVACYNVAWTQPGEWLAYDINVDAPGTYVFAVRASATANDRSLRIEVDGVDVSGSLPIENTGKWNNWSTITTVPVDLSAGTHTLKVYFETGYVDLDYIDAATGGMFAT